MIVRITETVYSEYSGVHKLEPVLYKIPGELQKMVDDIHHMSRDSSVKEDIFSAELTDSAFIGEPIALETYMHRRTDRQR